jgi:hypothetical protein
MLEEEEGLSRDLTDHNSERGSIGAMSSGESKFLLQEKFKRRQWMDASADYKAPDIIYRVKEGGETVPYRRNGPHWVELFNAFVLKRREKGGCEKTLVPLRRGD